MHKIGDYVIYKANGLCIIDDIRKEKFGSLAKQDYYVLKPASDKNSVVYVPVALEESEPKMRAPIQKSEAESLLASLPLDDMSWIFDDKLRQNTFREILDVSDIHKLASMVSMMISHNVDLLSIGRSMRNVDEIAMKKAQVNLFYELAHSLEKPIEEIENIIYNL